MAHALLAPSSAAVWSVCPGSVQMKQMMPAEAQDNAAAMEGAAAHWVAEQILRDAVENEGVSAASFDHLLGNTDPAGTIITKEMIEGAQLYGDFIDELGIEFVNYHIEQHVQIPSIHPECAGTPDFFGFNGTDLHIVDYKFGHGGVEAFENKQLLCYYAGIMDETGVIGIGDQDITVHFHVVQPRSYSGDGPIKTWRVAATDLRGLINQLSTAAHKAMGATPLTASGNQCRYCPARHSCESSRQTAASAIEYQNEAVPTPLTDDALAYELPVLLNAIKALQYRADALNDEAVARMGAGTPLFGLTMKQSYGHRSWTTDFDTIQNMGKMLNKDVDLAKAPALVSPAEAEKRLMKAAGLTKKAATEMLSGFAEKPARGMKVSIDTGAEARKVFSQ